VTPTQHLQRLAFQRVVGSNNPHLLGIAIEVMVVGSVSSVRSIMSGITSYSRKSRGGSTTPR
jgi:hypothetical protein